MLGRARSFRAFETCVDSANAAVALRHVTDEITDARGVIGTIDAETASLRALSHHADTEASGREVVLAKARHDVEKSTAREHSLVSEVAKREAEVAVLAGEKEALKEQMKAKVGETESLLEDAEPLRQVKKTREAKAKAARSREELVALIAQIYR